MRAYLAIAILFVALAVVSSATVDEESEPSHVIEKRETIFVKPPFPQCVFYECIASCKQRGYKRGGYCTINGCQCLR